MECPVLFSGPTLFISLSLPLTKKKVLIRRLELAFGPGRYPIKSVYRWSDSTVAPNWITGVGSYKQFVANGLLKRFQGLDRMETRG